ncbi:unnamed protein product [Penicillium salamii]|nr:unnamed protein product [Penicillium salamii]CAG8400641.1 unnamed protein product [Penicillium salamii]
MSHTFNDQTPGAEITRLFPERVRGKTCLKRGELAAATADALAAAQASTIICTGHCQAELQPVIDHINRKFKNVNMIFVTADTSSLASFREAGHAIKKIGLPIDGFIGFPSVMAAPWETTIDGFESHFQKNYPCYFLLVNLILDVMAPGSRIVLVTSSLRTEAPAPTWVDVGFSDYHCLDGYSQSMLAVILFVKSLSKMCGGRSITAFSANPGNTKTNIQTLFLLIALVQPGNILSAGEDIPVLLQQAPKSLAQGSATILRGLLDPDLEEQSGSFLDHCQTLTLPHLDFPAGQDSAAALWERSQGFLKQFL